jgi:hypothetical protein
MMGARKRSRDGRSGIRRLGGIALLALLAGAARAQIGTLITTDVRSIDSIDGLRDLPRHGSAIVGGYATAGDGGGGVFQ